MRKHQEQSLVLIAEELGVDLHKVYSQSCFFKHALPDFKDLYETYKLEVVAFNMNLELPEIEKQLAALREGSFLEAQETKELNLKSEIELFDYLLARHHSFSVKGLYHNMPVKEVW